MSQRTVEVYRRRLLAKRQELVQALSRSQEAGRKGEDLDTQDLADQANVTYATESLFQQATHERDMLTRVENALRRAEEGRFGRCTLCAEPVEKKRLEAMPWADLCVSCQHQQESGLL